MIGQTISRYKILEKLGEGGMGVVYKAEDTKLKRIVALKFLPPEFMRDTAAKERFLNEARAAAALEHQHICNIFEIDETREQIFIVMSCYGGQNLKEKLEDGPLKIEEAIMIALQVCEGLHEAHRKEIVHRDIKSANIMIDVRGQARIMDFGLAKLKGQTKITKEGSTLGTAAYMSPEQAQGTDTDHRTDIWSLGVVLYEMVTGQVPFRGNYEHATIYSILNEEPEHVSGLRTAVPLELERIIVKALAKDAADRYQHADDLAVDLKTLKRKLDDGEKSVYSLPAAVKPQRRWFAVTAALIFLAAVAALWMIILMQQPRTPSPDLTGTPDKRKKIVVLPFENLGPPEDKYFADGMTEEITSRLAAVRDLGVISRTSAVQYGRKGKTLKQIGKDLGVSYVLEGTVRWDRRSGEKGRVRVTPQLISVSDDTHLWSQRYDRVIDDIFTVQTEIAKHVIHHLGVTLLESEEQVLDARPTQNLEAYNAFLRGLEYTSHSGYQKREEQLALKMFSRAVELDPDFTLAYAELAKVHSEMYFMHMDHTKARISKAKAAIDRAIELQPDSPAVHLALGYYYYWCYQDYEPALKEFAAARKGLPNEAGIDVAVALIKRRQGRMDEAINRFKAATQLAPRDEEIYRELAFTTGIVRRYSQAEAHINRSISLNPDQVFAYGWKAYNYWLWTGDLGKARAALEQITRKNTAMAKYLWYWHETLARNYPDALSLAASFSGETCEIFIVFAPKSQLTGLIYRYMNKPELARQSFESARLILEKEVEKRPDEYLIHSSLGIVYAALDRKEQAIREGKRAVELLPVSRDAVWGPMRVERLAEIYVMVEEYDLALDQIEYLLSIPAYFSVPYLKLHPQYDPLRTHPRYKRLLAKYSQDKNDGS
jgi:TolB-like protein/Tfp pilus assembly protein PilF